MAFARSSGILLHPTSLPSCSGIGDLGPAAYEFVDFLAASRQTLWQVLPPNPPGMGNSPYSCTSAFAGNPLLVSLERLRDRGWLDDAAVSRADAPQGKVDFERVKERKLPLLRQAARNFLQRANGDLRSRFEKFCFDNREWLYDYALFTLLRERFGGKQWSAWPREFVQRDPATLDRFGRENAEQLSAEHAIQFFFFEQWQALHAACRARNIKLVGDIAIFVSHDSAEVWRHPEIFHLLPNGDPEFVAGVPPDAFSATGQRWGNPLYRWDALRARGYDWWVARMRAALATCDIVRLDHFRGFEKFWQIPAGEPTAVNGHWVEGPGEELFQALRGALGELPFIAEDLGFITPEVHALREKLNIPGMRVIQFGFGDPGAHMYLPHRFISNVVVYTGTHDNDTTRGWWKNSATPAERAAASEYFGVGREDEIAWAMIRAAASSVADLCIVPLQDVMNLGSEARMNTPSRPDGNWSWRYAPKQLTAEAARKLGALAEVTDRVNSAAGQQSHREAAKDFAA